VPWILAGACAIGALVAAHADAQHVVIFAIVICALSAVWCTDVRFGLVPDVFTLVPLGLVLAIAFVQRQPLPIASSAIAFVPFALLALFSKGRGMGWGDVKLATLGGAVLGGETALLAFAAGSTVAVVHAYVRGRQSRVIAFAPYLAGAIAVALPLAVP
jgi:prepilin signal peptidase PulO-like enzyme (type II secretory pathway)